MPKYETGHFNQIKYNNDFKKENYDEMRFLVPKGDRERIKALAKALQFPSVSQLVVNALEQQYGIKLSKD